MIVFQCRNGRSVRVEQSIRMSDVGHIFKSMKANPVTDRVIASSPHAPFVTPQLASAREYLVRAATQLWRVQDRRERVLGHVRIVADPRGLCYRAERLNLAAGGFRLIGEFWNVDDAVAALRYG